MDDQTDFPDNADQVFTNSSDLRLKISQAIGHHYIGDDELIAAVREREQRRVNLDNALGKLRRRLADLLNITWDSDNDMIEVAAQRLETGDFHAKSRRIAELERTLGEQVRRLHGDRADLRTRTRVLADALNVSLGEDNDERGSYFYRLVELIDASRVEERVMATAQTDALQEQVASLERVLRDIRDAAREGGFPVGEPGETRPNSELIDAMRAGGTARAFVECMRGALARLDGLTS